MISIVMKLIAFLSLLTLTAAAAIEIPTESPSTETERPNTSVNIEQCFTQSNENWCALRTIGWKNLFIADLTIYNHDCALVTQIYNVPINSFVYTHVSMGMGGFPWTLEVEVPYSPMLEFFAKYANHATDPYNNKSCKEDGEQRSCMYPFQCRG